MLYKIYMIDQHALLAGTDPNASRMEMHGWLQDELQRADEPERERMRRSKNFEGGRHTEHVGLVTQFCARGCT